mmetsp:Transcript_14126/g.38734  ORF Transcript_14126/g.38734 Transcript_14126/m.38734 type:complete len:497 (+) Transcript_14126:159-1649(+)
MALLVLPTAAARTLLVGPHLFRLAATGRCWLPGGGPWRRCCGTGCARSARRHGRRGRRRDRTGVIGRSGGGRGPAMLVLIAPGAQAIAASEESANRAASPAALAWQRCSLGLRGPTGGAGRGPSQGWRLCGRGTAAHVKEQIRLLGEHLGLRYLRGLAVVQQVPCGGTTIVSLGAAHVSHVVPEMRKASLVQMDDNGAKLVERRPRRLLRPRTQERPQVQLRSEGYRTSHLAALPVAEPLQVQHQEARRCVDGGLLTCADDLLATLTSPGIVLVEPFGGGVEAQRVLNGVSGIGDVQGKVHESLKREGAGGAAPVCTSALRNEQPSEKATRGRREVSVRRWERWVCSGVVADAAAQNLGVLSQLLVLYEPQQTPQELVGVFLRAEGELSPQFGQPARHFARPHRGTAEHLQVLRTYSLRAQRAIQTHAATGFRQSFARDLMRGEVHQHQAVLTVEFSPLEATQKHAIAGLETYRRRVGGIFAGPGPYRVLCHEHWF